MRVLLLAESLRPDAASAAHSLAGMVQEFETRGMHATLLAADAAGTEVLGFDSHSLNTSYAQDPTAAVGDHDIVHFFGWDYPLAQRALAAALSLRKPYVVSPLGCLNASEKRSLGQQIRWWLGGRGRLTAARHALAMNEWEAKTLREARVHGSIQLFPLGLGIHDLAPADPDRATKGLTSQVPHTPARRTDVSNPNSLPKAPYLLVLGPIDPPSGAVALLKALAEIGPDADGWSVVFAGRLERHWQQMLEAAVRRKGGEERVRFINDADVPTQRALLAGCGMVVAPALRSRPPIAMMQALAAGVPACGTRCAAPAEIDAHTCEPDRIAMRDMLSAMLRQTEGERRETALRLQAQACHRLSWSALIDRYIDLYVGVSGPRL